jgi:hypothetical protein
MRVFLDIQLRAADRWGFGTGVVGENRLLEIPTAPGLYEAPVRSSMGDLAVRNL